MRDLPVFVSKVLRTLDERIKEHEFNRDLSTPQVLERERARVHECKRVRWIIYEMLQNYYKESEHNQA